MSSRPPGYEDSVVCPYNKSHIILRHRLQTHLIKCARSNPHIQLELCPFDVTHRIPKEEMAQHTNECPSREGFDRYVFSVDTGNRTEVKERNRPSPPQPTIRTDTEEDWDHFDCPTYDPRQYAESTPVLRAPGLMTPSERRKFADAERKRLSELTRRH